MTATGAVADWQLAASALVTGNGRNWVDMRRSAYGHRHIESQPYAKGLLSFDLSVERVFASYMTDPSVS